MGYCFYLATILWKKKKSAYRHTQINRHRKTLEQSQETVPKKGNMEARRREIFTFHLNTLCYYPLNLLNILLV